MNELNVSDENHIRNKIFTIQGLQVMLDNDLAELYEVETKQFNRAVKRNIERFPERFMFQLTPFEYSSLRCQNGTLKNRRGKHRKYLPYVFTEQGVSMLSGVLNSKTAINISIQIIDAFVAMKRFISSNAQIFQRLDRAEMKQIEHDKKFEQVFRAIENKQIVKKQGIFFNGQIFDAYKFVSNIIRSAEKSIVLVDNYIDDSVLTLFIKRKDKVRVIIYTKIVSKQLKLDIDKYNAQYPSIEIKEFKHSHDRFLIIDNKEVYHIGASLKDLGKKWFAFSKLEKEAFELLSRLV